MPLTHASKPPKGTKVQQPAAAARSARQAARSARQAAPSALVLPAHSKAANPKITSPKLGNKASIKLSNCLTRGAGRGR